MENKLPVLGLVITQKNEAAMLNHNIEYHRYMGVSRFYIFDDGSTDGSMQTIQNTHGVHQFFGTDFSIVPEEMADVKQKALDGNWVGRQYLNTYKALQLAKKDGVDWLLFIDADELVFLESEQENSFPSFFAEVDPDVDTVFFKKVYEVIPQNTSASNIFKKANLFKATAYDINAEKTMFDPILGKMFSLSGFFGPSLGKQAARVNANLLPESSHGFKKRNGESPKELIFGQVMHYHLCDFPDFIKRSSIKHPSHFVYGSEAPYYPKMFWRELVLDSGLNESELRTYYERWIVYSEEEINLGKNKLEGEEPYIVSFNGIANVWKKIEEKMMDDIKSMVIEKYKATFTILSKNACTSTKAHIVKNLGLPQTVVFPKDVHEPGIYDYPFTSDEELTATFHSYLRFCIIRNPWSRLVSCFKDKVKPTPINNYLYKNGVHVRFICLSSKFQSGMSFEDFVDVICQIPDSKADAHFRSQLYDIVTLKGKLRVNYIAKLENLDKHFEVINRLAGMSFEEFPILNTTDKKKPYTDYYSPKIIEKVRKRYAGDIQLFNYQFGAKDEFDSGIINRSKENEILASPFFSAILEEKNNAIAAKKREMKNEKSGKIFCIGLNKTGTRSLHTALNILGFKAAHHDSPIGRIGEIFKANAENNRELLTGLDNFDAFSDWIDMEGSNNHFFKIMDQQYPGSKFIFTDRDIEGWIESRIKHVKKDSRLEAFQKAYPASIWYNMNTLAWENEYKRHKADVLNYFKDRKEDLLIYNLFEGDSWEKLCSFLQVSVPKRPFPTQGKSSYTAKIFFKVYLQKGNILIQNRNTIFYFLAGSGNLPIKASLISYLERKRKFEFPTNIHLVDEFPFPCFKKASSHPSLKRYFRFTIVRNPWDRLVAFYTDMICSDDLPETFFMVGTQESFNENGNFFQRNMPFNEFIERVCSIPESKANRYFGSQIYQLTTADGELLVNYIGYYENLKQTASDIFDQTQISLHEIPSSKGKVDDTSYTNMYSQELQEKVRKRFAADIEVFGYEFGVPYESLMIGFVSDEFISRFKSSSFYIDILKEKNRNLANRLTSSLQEVAQFKQDLSRKELETERLQSGQQVVVYYKEESKAERLQSEHADVDYKKKFEAIQHSLSWKITAPLRYISGMLIKILGKKTNHF